MSLPNHSQISSLFWMHRHGQPFVPTIWVDLSLARPLAGELLHWQSDYSCASACGHRVVYIEDRIGHSETTWPLLYPVQLWSRLEVSLGKGEMFPLTTSNAPACPMGLLGSMLPLLGMTLTWPLVRMQSWWGSASFSTTSAAYSLGGANVLSSKFATPFAQRRAAALTERQVWIAPYISALRL